MVACGRCQAKTFISGDLAPFATEECKKCGHPVMLPVMLNNFELRTIIASGGIASLDDIKALMAAPATDILGTIIGRALYEGSFAPSEALALADSW